MDQALTITLWVFSRIFIGGLELRWSGIQADRRLAEYADRDRRGRDWQCGLGNPLWLVLWQTLPPSSDQRVSWQRDADDWKQALAAPRSDAVTPGEMVAGLRRLLWPAARTDGHSHRASYVGVFVALAILTAVEVLLTVIDFGVSMTGPLVALSTTKVLLVALFFMHLRYDSRWYSSIFVYAFPFAALIVIILALAA
jgi:caa(3)-type oxidase subunit IV